MPAVRHVTAKEGDVVLLVGTTKGAFLLRSNAARSRWEVGGPLLPRARRSTRWATTAAPAGVASGPARSSVPLGPRRCAASDDFGRTWSDPSSGRAALPRGDRSRRSSASGRSGPGARASPTCSTRGVEPAALFESRDGGATWSLVRGLWDHPHRARWQPGGGGLCLHTIVPRSDRPAAHARRDLDRRRLPHRRRRRDVAQPRTRACARSSCPTSTPSSASACTRSSRHPARPERLFLQNHWGLYRSDDGGDLVAGHRERRAVGLRLRDGDAPARSGHRLHRAARVGRVPLHARGPAARLPHPRRRARRGSRSRDGLPQKDALETVLRDALRLRRAQSGRRLLRHAQRQAVRLARWRAPLGPGARRPAADPVREGRGGRRSGEGAGAAHEARGREG